MNIELFLFAIILCTTRVDSNCFCRKLGSLLICLPIADQFDILANECRRSAKMLIWTSTSCPSGVMVITVKIPPIKDRTNLLVEHLNN